MNSALPPMRTGGKPAGKPAAWTGLLDDAIGRGRRLRGKLVALTFIYSAAVSVTVLFLLARGFDLVSRVLPDVSPLVFFSMLVVLLFLFAAIAAGVLDFLLMRPLRTLEQVNPDATLGEMISKFFSRHAALEDQFSKLAREVGTLASERRDLAQRITTLASRAATSTAMVRSVLGMSRECLIVTGLDGCIQELSDSACELLGTAREHLIGAPFDEAVKLHDFDHGKPARHPLTGLMLSAMEQRSTIPMLSQLHLAGTGGGGHSVTVFTAAVAGEDGTVIAGLCRLEPLDAAGTAAAPAAAPVASDAERFGTAAEALVGDARRAGASHALLFLSIDRPATTVTDRFGHAAGVSLEWEVSRIVEAHAPEGQAFKMASNHWGVLLRNADVEAAKAAAEKVRAAVDGREFRWRDKRYDATITVAVVAITAETESVSLLLDRADQTLIAAKLAGGNRVQLDTAPRPGSGRRADAEWSDWLNEHLKHGRLHLISQEIRPLAKDAAPMLEMLARVEAEDGSWETPGNFLPELARHDLMARLDLQLIKRVVTTLERNPANAAAYRTVFVNLSGASIAKPRFSELVLKVLGNGRIPAGRIGFEIDVLEAIEHPGEFAQFVTAVKPSGALFALDKCKAAMGLNVLNSLPIDFVKIHPSLVERAATDQLDRAYVEWIQRAVKLLGRRTIATGVQNDKTLAFVTRAGVDYVQGVHINKLGPLII